MCPSGASSQPRNLDFNCEIKIKMKFEAVFSVMNDCT